MTATGTIPSDATDELVGKISHEYTSLSSAEAGATDSNHLNTTDLKTNNLQLNFPAYYDNGADTNAVSIDGYTTGQPNYIKIYTPNSTDAEVNLSQRHSGVWNDGKYYMTYSGQYNNNIGILAGNIKIIGIQLEKTATENQRHGIMVQSSIDNLLVSDVIVRGQETGIRNIGATNCIIKNSIVYDSTDGIISAWTYQRPTSYIHNNTVSNNSDRGIFGDSNSVLYFANNISNNSGSADYDVELVDSDNNISSDSTSPDGASFRNKTIKFLDEKNDDFRLSPKDTVANDAGIDLSTSTTYAFTLDNVGHTRVTDGYWDIGANEAATEIFRSVGPGNTLPLATGTSNSLSITGSTATFANSMPLNMGVGDVIQYDANNDGTVDALAFVHGRTSDKIYTVKNVNGTEPTATTVADNDWSVFRAYTSLANAEAGTENTGIDDTLEDFETYSDGKDIFSSNEQWNIAAYADAPAEYTHIDNWTNAPQNYLRLYTPYKDNEVGITQRHSGVWDNSKFALVDSNVSAIYLDNDYTRIEGLQVKITAADGRSGVRYERQSGGGLYVSDNIFWGVGTTGTAIDFSSSNIANSAKAYVNNNIVYGFGSGVAGYDSTLIKYIYNNTVHSCTVFGFAPYSPGNTFILKNNIAYNNANNYATYSGGYDTINSDYNISGPGVDAQMPGTNSLDGVTVTFRDATNNDFRLDPYDTSARNAGVNLQNDPYLWFEYDIEGDARDGSWDIGADEVINVTIMPTAKTEDYNSTVGLNDGLVGYWTFDGPDVDLDNNIIYDRSGHYNNGTASGSPQVAIGKHGQALEFDGVDDFIDIDGDFPSGNSERTINLWFNTDEFDISYYDAIFTYDYGGLPGGDFGIFVEDNAISLSFYSHVVISPKGYLKKGQWYNVSVVVPVGATTTSDVLVYIDGVSQVLTDEGGSSQTLNTQNTNIQIADRDVSDMHYDGKLDEFRFYNRALSSSEILALYNKNKTQFQSSQKEYHKKGLVGYWSFDGADVDWSSSTAEIIDRSGNGVMGDATASVRSGIGKIGQALTFNGTDSYIDFGSSGLIGTGTVTACAWIYPEDFGVPGYSSIIENGKFIFSINQMVIVDEWGPFTSDRITFTSNDSTVKSSAHNSIVLNEWQHVCVERDLVGLANIYINGTISGTAEESSGTPTVGADFYVGGGLSQFDGRIDEVRIYNYSLSAEEIKALYGSGRVETKQY